MCAANMSCFSLAGRHGTPGRDVACPCKKKIFKSLNSTAMLRTASRLPASAQFCPCVSCVSTSLCPAVPLHRLLPISPTSAHILICSDFGLATTWNTEFAARFWFSFQSVSARCPSVASWPCRLLFSKPAAASLASHFPPNNLGRISGGQALLFSKSGQARPARSPHLDALYALWMRHKAFRICFST